MLAGDPADVQTMLLRLVDFLKVHQITAVFTSLTHAALGPFEATEVGVSSLMDTWILLRDIELAGERNRGIYVLKSRGMKHSNQIREFLLTDRGVQLRDVYLGEVRRAHGIGSHGGGGRVSRRRGRPAGGDRLARGRAGSKTGGDSRTDCRAASGDGVRRKRPWRDSRNETCSARRGLGKALSTLQASRRADQDRPCAPPTDAEPNVKSKKKTAARLGPAPLCRGRDTALTDGDREPPQDLR